MFFSQAGSSADRRVKHPMPHGQVNSWRPSRTCRTTRPPQRRTLVLLRIGPCVRAKRLVPAKLPGGVCITPREWLVARPHQHSLSSRRSLAGLTYQRLLKKSAPRDKRLRWGGGLPDHQMRGQSTLMLLRREQNTRGPKANRACFIYMNYPSR